MATVGGLCLVARRRKRDAKDMVMNTMDVFDHESSKTTSTVMDIEGATAGPDGHSKANRMDNIDVNRLSAVMRASHMMMDRVVHDVDGGPIPMHTAGGLAEESMDSDADVISVAMGMGTRGHDQVMDGMEEDVHSQRDLEGFGGDRLEDESREVHVVLGMELEPESREPSLGTNEFVVGADDDVTAGYPETTK